MFLSKINDTLKFRKNLLQSQLKYCKEFDILKLKVAQKL